LKSFKALVLSTSPTFSSSVEEISLNENPNSSEVVVRVEWSGINYKDGLAVTNSGKIIRGAFPFVPGIDLAGVVHSSENPAFKPGDRVLSTGWGLGESHWGGYSQYQQLPAQNLLHIPDHLTTRESMIIGTAGFTSMLAAMEIEDGPGKKDGKFLVTGASGGVGSFSVIALAHMGLDVVAVTGKKEAESYLLRLGASEVVDRGSFSGGASAPLDSARWAGCIDSVGSTTLEAVLSQTARHGTVAACGLAGGASLNTSVFPFILRGVRLVGIDSNTCPNDIRKKAWNKLGDLARKIDLNQLAHEIKLDQVPESCQRLMKGEVMGRYLVDLS
jgi:acrylyl-CoA reductase (NADPH)